MRLLIRTFLVLLLLAAAGAGWCLWEAKTFLETPPQAEGAQVTVDIRPGATMKTLAPELKAKGVITDDFRFRLLARWKKSDSKLQAGRFAFRTDWLPEQVLDWLVSGKPVLTRVTIPEGLTWWQTAAVLEEAGLVKASDFEAVVTDPAFLKKYAIPFPTAEGFLMPDTYLLKTPMPGEQPDRESARKIAVRLVDNFYAKLSAAWPGWRKAGTDALKKTVILASIVEKETAIASERPRVAGVYDNRLKKGMLLQADPTVIYGLGKTFNGNITRANLQDDANAYNTYRRPGLPPGPICSFGKSAIEAALHPEAHDFLYFVAVTDGGAHAFSKTLTEHNAAVQRYLQNRRKQR